MSYETEGDKYLDVDIPREIVEKFISKHGAGKNEDFEYDLFGLLKQQEYSFETELRSINESLRAERNLYRQKYEDLLDKQKESKNRSSFLSKIKCLFQSKTVPIQWWRNYPEEKYRKDIQNKNNNGK